MKKNKVLFISDSTIDNLSNLFKKEPLLEEYEILDNPQGPVISNLLNIDFERDGDYYKVIDDEKMKKVIEKINSGNYKYQL